MRRSPWLLDEVPMRRQLGARATQLYFFGALCWKTATVVHTIAQLAAKCKTSYEQPGFLSKYAFGLRYEIFRRHRDAAGFRMIATDYSPSLAGGRHDIDAEILGAKFCLAPAGTGWGMRVFHVMALGCVPVLVQDDGVHQPVAQAFEPELLDWSEFSVPVRHDQVAELPALLRAVDLPAKQAALRRVWSRMVWRHTLSSPLREQLPGPDAFDSTIAMLLAHAMPGSVQRVTASSSPPRRPN